MEAVQAECLLYKRRAREEQVLQKLGHHHTSRTRISRLGSEIMNERVGFRRRRLRERVWSCGEYDSAMSDDIRMLSHRRQNHRHDRLSGWVRVLSIMNDARFLYGDSGSVSTREPADYRSSGGYIGEAGLRTHLIGRNSSRRLILSILLQTESRTMLPD